MIHGIIYKIENLKSNKVYIGQTTRKNGFKGRYPSSGVGIERVYNFLLKSNLDNHLLRSIEKYGFNNFRVIEEFDTAYSQDELNAKEIYWINHYKSYNSFFGYNKKSGGSKGELSKETYFEYAIKRNFINPVILDDGRIFTTLKEACKKTNRTQKNLNFKFLDEVSGRSVVCLNTCEIFQSATVASKFYYCNRTSIVRCCNQKAKSAGRDNEDKKLVWVYFDKYISEHSKQK